MLTNRCRCCDRELTEYENKWDELIQDYNDLCNHCLRYARDRKEVAEYTVNVDVEGYTTEDDDAVNY